MSVYVREFKVGQVLYSPYNPQPIIVIKIGKLISIYEQAITLEDKEYWKGYNKYEITIVNSKGQELTIEARPSEYKDFNNLLADHEKKLNTLTTRKSKLLKHADKFGFKV